MPRLPLAILFASITALTACAERAVVGDPLDPPAGPADDPGLPSRPTDPIAPGSSWGWLHPRPAGNTFRAVAGPSTRDLWLVGDHGTVQHWDGANLTQPYRGAATDVFYTAAARGPGDVWIAGDGTGPGSRVVHFDGKAWSTDYSLSSFRVHALHSTDGGAVYAVADDGASARILRWTGAAWTGVAIASDPNTLLPGFVLLRDMWSARGSEQPWVVGDHGYLGRLQTTPNAWFMRHGTPQTTALGDPFDAALSYVGVWGASDVDVWAMFLAADGIGFSHFDGATWRITQRAVQTGVTWPAAPITFLPKGPLRSGRVLTGGGGSIVANARVVSPPGYYPSGSAELLWNGTQFVGSQQMEAAAPNEDLSTKRGLWSDGTTTIGVGDVGRFLRWSATAKPRWTSENGGGTRFDLRSVAPLAIDLAYGTDASGRAARWDGATWSEVSMPPVAGGADAPWLNDTFARSADDVWAVGYVRRADGGSDPKFSDGYIAHGDGKTWTATRLPDADRFSSVFAIARDDVWAVGEGPPYDWTLPSLVAYHFDGTSWTKIAVPTPFISAHGIGHEGGIASTSVFGLSTREVWISGLRYGEPQNETFVVRWNGTALVTEYYGATLHASPREGRVPRLWGTRSDDLWLAASPAVHFDGKEWRPFTAGTDRVLFGIAGTRDGEIWSVGEATQGGAIRRIGSAGLTNVLEASPRLTAIAESPAGDLWVVGDGSATLRYAKAQSAR